MAGKNVVKRPTMDDVKIFFTKQAWDLMDDEERYRHLDIYDNYIGLDAMGLNPHPPPFVTEFYERLKTPSVNLNNTPYLPVKDVHAKMKQVEEKQKNHLNAKMKKASKFIPPTLGNVTGGTKITPKETIVDISTEKLIEPTESVKNDKPTNMDSGSNSIDSEANYIQPAVKTKANASPKKKTAGDMSWNKSVEKWMNSSEINGITEIDTESNTADSDIKVVQAKLKPKNVHKKKNITNKQEGNATSSAPSSRNSDDDTTFDQLTGRNLKKNHKNHNFKINEGASTSNGITGNKQYHKRQSGIPDEKIKNGYSNYANTKREENENPVKNIPEEIMNKERYRQLHQKYLKKMEELKNRRMPGGQTNDHKERMAEIVRSYNKLKAFKEGFLRGSIAHENPEVRRAAIDFLERSRSDPVKKQLLEKIKEVRGVDAPGLKKDQMMEDELMKRAKAYEPAVLHHNKSDSKKLPENEERGDDFVKPAHWVVWPHNIDDHGFVIPTVPDCKKKRFYPKRGLTKTDYPEVDDEDNRYVYCETCYREWLDSCPEHNLHTILNKKVPMNTRNRAEKTIPDELSLGPSKTMEGRTGVYTNAAIPADIVFGPYEGKKIMNPMEKVYSWQIRVRGKVLYWVDGSNLKISNWMRYVNCARHKSQVNIKAFQYRGDIYYRTTRFLPPGTELLIFYGFQYAASLGITRESFENPERKLIKTRDNQIKNEEITEGVEEHLHSSKQAGNIFTSVTHQFSLSDENEMLPLVPANTAEQSHYFPSVREGNDKFTSLRGSNEEAPALTKDENVYLNGECSEFHLIKESKLNNVCELNQTVENKQLGRKDDLTDHVTAKNIKIKPNKCELCDYSSIRKSDLTKHIRAVHDNIKPYKCELCDFSASVKGNLTIHVRAVHDNIKPYKCELCDYSATLKGHLTIHVRAVHDNIKPYKCELCDFSATQKGNLTIHVRAVHDNIKPYKCEFCDFSATLKGTLTRHIRAVHENIKPYKCELCDYSATRKDTLTDHIRAKHK